MKTIDDAKLRAWRWARQGLDGSLVGKKAADVLETTGWVRSVGGASPYLALFARAGIGRAEVNADVATLADLPHHAIVDRGCVIGFWEYDAGAGAIASSTFDKPSAAVRAAVARMETFVHDDLGDARTFSLDGPDTRGERIAAVKRLGG